MIEFEAVYFDGITSKAHSVTVRAEGAFLYLQPEGAPLLCFSLHECAVAPPLGKTTRSIKLPGGAVCETDDLRAIDVLEKELGANSGMRLVNLMENRWKTVALCFMGLAFCVWAFITYGIPYTAAKVAYAVPSEMAEVISQKTLDVLDDHYLEPSGLGRKRKADIRLLFRGLLREEKAGLNYRLEFRRSSLIGPNAFALPSGTIVLTDELIELAVDELELAAILLHEMAHVEKRHGLRSVLQNAGVFLLVSILVGDVSSITSTAATLPTLLAESGYSRQFEREADRMAGLFCIRRGWGTGPLRSILQRLDKGRFKVSGESILSTHPDTAERIRLLEEMEYRKEM